MSNNYDRYDGFDEQRYNRRGISYYVLRKTADKTIIPYLSKIKNKKCLEVGVGYGYYKNIYFDDNRVIGYDVNAQLVKNLSIETIVGKADEISKKVKERFDYVLSFFMTEYLNKEELKKFIDQGLKMLNPQGIFCTTIILKKGMGGLYTYLARMKGIKKYSYSMNEIKEILGGTEYKVYPLRSLLGIPFAVLLEVKNER